MEMNTDRAKMAEMSKIIKEKRDDPWNGESRPRRQKKKKKGKSIITYHRISKRLAVIVRVLLLHPIMYAHHCSKVSMSFHICKD